MKGVVFLGHRELEIRDFPDPVPGPGEVVLEIKASGMCGSDLKYYRAESAAASLAALGYTYDGTPIISGHEPSGIVAQIGPGVKKEEASLGDRVMVHHYLGCGTCKHCLSGWPQLCLQGVKKIYGVKDNGAHANFMKVAASTLVKLPKELTFSAGSAISCGTGTAYSALKRIGLSEGDTIAVFGQGPVGLSVTQLATAMNARVIALDVTPERLELAREFGAEEVLDPSQVDAVASIRELTGGEGAHFSIDCSSAPSARVAAVQCVRTWGTACYVGEGGNVTLDVSKDLLRRQVTIIGSWTFSRQLQAECAQFIIEHEVDVDRLFTHRFKLEEAAEAYMLFDTQKIGKGVFEL